MSSKAENTSQNSSQQHRLTIFCRYPLLLKIVAWLGSLSFIGNAGIGLADFTPISVSSAEKQEILQASASTPVTEKQDVPTREMMGPHLPLVSQQTVATIAINPASHDRAATATKVAPDTNPPTPTRRQHADVISADNYTVSAIGPETRSVSLPNSVSISVPAPINAVTPDRIARTRNSSNGTREIVTQTSSEVSSSQGRKRAIVSQSVPASGVNPKSRDTYIALRPLPKVNLNRSTVDRGATANRVIAPTPVASNHHVSTGNRRALVGLQPQTVPPLKPSPSSLRRKAPTFKTARVEPIQPIVAQTAVVIPVPPPLTQTVKVPQVAQLPQLTTDRAVPRVTPLPVIKPATVAQQPAPQRVAINNVDRGAVGYESGEIGYPLANVSPITSRYGWRTHPISGSRRFHAGLDFGAPMGAPVVAAGGGQVVSAGWMSGYGKTIVIQHNGTQQTLYAHLSDISVQPGQTLARGTVIGRVGSTGNSTGPHLHFEIRVATNDGWVATDPYHDVRYALDNMQRATPVVQRDLPHSF
jgi:murein DD-endopeptidase MepM/ murein hydrolase activator NlpD